MNELALGKDPSRRPRVLVTDSGYKHALGVVRQLGPTADVFTCGTRRFSMAGVSRWTRGNLRCPPVSSGDAFLRWLDEAIRRHRIDQVIPVGFAACRLLAAHPDRWAPAARIVLPPASAMERALDKRAVNELGSSLGVPVPRTAQPSTVSEVEACAEVVGFPLVIKGPSEGSSDVAYVERPGEMAAAYRAYLVRNRWDAPSLPILQQRIVGPGFGVFATYQDGRCRRLMAHRRIREYPASGGASSCAEVVSDPVLFDLGRRILDALQWHGVAMVEFKRHDADGRYYLMEVNPKLWGSLDLALAAGCDFPGDLLRIGRGEVLPEMPPPTEPLRFCWPLSGDLRHLAERPRAWREVVRDWLDPAVRTNLRWSDPLPNLVELAEAGRLLVPRSR